MFSREKIITSMQIYLEKIDNAARLINEADKIVLGIGSGLSAAGGLCYTDPALTQKWYPEYYSMGLRTIVDIQSMFWWLSKSDPVKYWAFWAQHIWHIRYEAEATKPYLDLLRLVGGKDYFICTTNADSQVEKAGFAIDRTLAVQGNYCYFQCSKPCSDEVYYNEEMITTMINNMVSPFEIRTEDIPVCPRCGKPLVPNLRCDNRFVEKPHLLNLPQYERYVMDSENKVVVFVELGVGYNTPVIIRYPFERLTHAFKNAHLIRVNSTCAEVPKNIENKSVSLQEDLATVMSDLRHIEQ